MSKKREELPASMSQGVLRRYMQISTPRGQHDISTLSQLPIITESPMIWSNPKPTKVRYSDRLETCKYNEETQSCKSKTKANSKSSHPTVLTSHCTATIFTYSIIDDSAPYDYYSFNELRDVYVCKEEKTNSLPTLIIISENMIKIDKQNV